MTHVTNSRPQKSAQKVSAKDPTVPEEEEVITRESKEEADSQGWAFPIVIPMCRPHRQRKHCYTY